MMATYTVGMVPLFAVLLAAGACRQSADEYLSRRLGEANDKVVACKREVNDLKNQVSGLKQQLALALGNPNRITITDPEIINLIADFRSQRADGHSLDPNKASKVILQGARAMQACYERALKKNAALQYQAGVRVTLDVTVRAAGTVEAVDLSPSLDSDMVGCIRTAAARWKFPSFSGEPVVVSQRLTLTPKT
jgi:hypothetical protein